MRKDESKGRDCFASEHTHTYVWNWQWTHRFKVKSVRWVTVMHTHMYVLYIPIHFSKSTEISWESCFKAIYTLKSVWICFFFPFFSVIRLEKGAFFLGREEKVREKSWSNKGKQKKKRYYKSIKGDGDNQNIENRTTPMKVLFCHCRRRHCIVTGKSIRS